MISSRCLIARVVGGLAEVGRPAAPSSGADIRCEKCMERGVCDALGSIRVRDDPAVAGLVRADFDCCCEEAADSAADAAALAAVLFVSDDRLSRINSGGGRG